MNSIPRSSRFLAFPWSLTTPAVLLALAAVSVSAGDAPSRVVPSGFVDTQPEKPCLVQIDEQGLTKDIAQLQAAVHACMKSRFNQIKASKPELYPIEGKAQTNRPK